MKIIQAKGQTCNQFWIYSHYFAESIVSGEKILILAPDIAFQNYPNLLKQNFLKFPLYNKNIVLIFSYNIYIHILNNIFNNKFSIKILTSLFNVIPKISFIEGKMEAFTSTNRVNYSVDLKKIFKPKETVIKTVNTFINHKRSSLDVIVGIHIRRGDYSTWKNGEFFFSDKDYTKVMSQIESLFQNQKVGFLICSNEKIELKNFKKFEAFVFDESSAVIDLYGLSLCDYIIGPPSSYSAWASYYGNVPLYFIKDIKNLISLDQFTNEEFHWPPLRSIIEKNGT